jgi:hypothetical protein
LCRLGGDLPLATTRLLAQKLATEFSAVPGLVADLNTNDVPRLQVSGLPEPLTRRPPPLLRLSVENTSPGERFVARVWLSRGEAKAAADPSTFRLRLPNSAEPLTVRYFAAFDDNFIAVESHTLHVEPGG